MKTENWGDQQIKVKLIKVEESLKIVLPNGQSFLWPNSPFKEDALPQEVYLILSPVSSLPSQQELAKLVLQEILKPDLNK